MKRKSVDLLSVDPIQDASGYQQPAPSHPHLLQHPFSCMITAPKGSGKTTLICNLLLKQYKGYFHKVYVFSPTVANDTKWDVVRHTDGIVKKNKKLEKLKKDLMMKGMVGMDSRGVEKIPKVVFKREPLEGEKPVENKPKSESFDGRIPSHHFYVDYSMGDLQAILDQQQEDVEWLKRKKKPTRCADRICFIFDDLVGSNLFSMTRTENAFKALNVRHRHFNASLIMVTQAYKEVPKTYRSNTSAHIVFDVPNQSELETIYEENPCNLKKEEWMAVFRYATSQPYDFLYINYQRPKGQRLMRNFESVLEVGT
jgi:hypothetical protein